MAFAPSPLLRPAAVNFAREGKILRVRVEVGDSDTATPVLNTQVNIISNESDGENPIIDYRGQWPFAWGGVEENRSFPTGSPDADDNAIWPVGDGLSKDFIDNYLWFARESSQVAAGSEGGFVARASDLFINLRRVPASALNLTVNVSQTGNSSSFIVELYTLIARNGHFDFEFPPEQTIFFNSPPPGGQSNFSGSVFWQRNGDILEANASIPQGTTL